MPPDATDEADPMREAQNLISSARALLKELVEEDVSSFSPLPPSRDSTTNTEQRTDSSRPASPRAASPQPTPPEETGPDTPRSENDEPPWADRRPELDEVRRHLGDCTRCDLSRGRQSIVFGDGNPNADLMFIGEAPGEQEDLRGLPFVGRAGELLTQMIEKGIGIARSEVYICNIVKCRPPRNRNPLPPEVSACRPFLDGQIRAVAPRVIVTLGKPAAGLLLGREVAITRLRGTWQEYQGIPLMPTLHPAYVLRQYTPENRRAVWQDLQAAFERSRA